MASSAVASKGEGVPLSALLKAHLASPSASGKSKAAAAARRLSLLSTLFSDDSSEEDSSDEDSSDEDAAAAAAATIAKLFSGDVLDAATNMRLLLALTEEDDVGVAASRTGFSKSGWWVSKVDADAVQLKVAMPGLGKEHVKMRAEKDVLVIKGKEEEEGDGDKGSARDSYSYRIVLSSQAFKMDQIKAEMNNGMLSLTVPKIKDEERKDVFEIKIE